MNKQRRLKLKVVHIIINRETQNKAKKNKKDQN